MNLFHTLRQKAEFADIVFILMARSLCLTTQRNLTILQLERRCVCKRLAPYQITFESSQNLVSLLPWASKMATGQALPFAPYDEATGTYMDVPSDNKSEEYYRFWAPYCRGKGVLEGTRRFIKGDT